MAISVSLLRCSCLALALLAPAAAQDVEVDPEVEEFLAAWAARVSDVRSLRVEFTQTKRLRLLRKPLRGEGVTLLRGRRLKMVVRGDDGEVQIELAVDQAAGEARLYSPGVERVEVFSLAPGAAPPPSPFPLFGDDVERLPELYRIELRREEGDVVLDMTPRDEASELAQLVMRFRDLELVEVVQRSRRGDEVRMEIEAFVVDAEVDEADLELDVPPGTEVVRAMESER